MKRGILVLLVAYSLIHLAGSIFLYNPIRNPEVSGNLHQAFVEAAELRRTGSLSLLGDINVFYPAFYYLLLRPFTFFPFEVADYFFYLLQFALFPAAIFLLVQAVSGGRPAGAFDYLLAGILAVNFQPFLEAMALHKVEGIEFFLISLAIFLFWKGRDYWVGGVLLLAANLKYLPGILILYFLLKRNGKVLLGVLGVGTILLVFLWVFTGTEAMVSLALRHPLDLIFSGRPESNHLAVYPDWVGLSGTVNRWFAQIDPSMTLGEFLRRGLRTVPSQPLLAFWIALFLKLILCWLFVHFFILRSGRSCDRQKDRPFYLLEISQSLLMLVIGIQAFRTHYGILILPAFLLTGLLLISRWELFHLTEKLLFFLAYSLSGMIIPGGLLDQLPAHPVWGQMHSRIYQWWSLPFYGYLLLFLSILLCYERLRKDRLAERVPLKDA